jgi:hypothetical protein
MPDWTMQVPSCYFINYTELFIFSIIGAVVGYELYTHEVFKKNSPMATKNRFGQT